MNRQAATVIGAGFLKGAFDVFDALLSTSFSTQVEELAQASEMQMRDWLAEYPVCLRTRAENSVMQAAMLFSEADALAISDLVLGAEPGGKAALAQEDYDVLKEVAESALGGGLTSLMESFGRNVEQLERTEVLDLTPDAVDELIGYLETNPTAVIFRFAADNLNSKAVFLYSSKTEKLVPGEVLAKAAAAPRGGSAAARMMTEASLSPEEMSDILSGFDTPDAGRDAAQEAPSLRAGGQEFAQANLDMVLDIRLVATARLGRVEMPIGDILNLGPGSIIEVGHLIDEPIELLVNDRLIARGDVVVVDEKFGLRITEIISQQARIQTLR
jgi:flagellar motor switch protein FliN/FliY